MLEEFDIDRFIVILKENYKKCDAPVVTFAANNGATPFEILVSTVLSLRTKDEVTTRAVSKLFKVARTPGEILNLDEEQLKRLIYPVGFYPTKAKRLRQISRIIIDQYQGTVPDEIDELLKLPGVGRKTANLVLIEGYKKDAMCVDTHVHRINNRTGYVKTTGPEKTEFALREKLPGKYWKIYNKILVAFGQVICKPVSPLCSTCPVSQMCPRIGVKISR
ncbi:MAG: endonuclease III [Deltaproteobacteria bacterium]|nr:endonuclease III [Deltaproteobacteria bacterium]MBW2099668.1 endonuclease III [Deltaproteobacteria bacterium]